MAKKKRKRNKSSKGSQFERQICKLLSLWWSNNKSDAIFWRTSTSGARATSRAKKGRKTSGQCGDICATHPSGAPFVDVFTVELKNGYGKASPFDLIDKWSEGRIQIWDRWIEQATRAWETEGTFSWMLITKRKGRHPIVTIPAYVVTEIRDRVAVDLSIIPGITFHNKGYLSRSLRLDAFLRVVTPNMIRDISQVC